MFRTVPLSIIRNFSLYTQQCFMSANAWMVSPYTQHTISQHITVQPAHTTTPPPLGWCHHIHSLSTRNSVQCNQHTQQHHLHLDGVTIHTAYQLATQYSATSRHNNTTSACMVSPYMRYINRHLSTYNSINISCFNGVFKLSCKT